MFFDNPFLPSYERTESRGPGMFEGDYRGPIGGDWQGVAGVCYGRPGRLAHWGPLPQPQTTGVGYDLATLNPAQLEYLTLIRTDLVRHVPKPIPLADRLRRWWCS